MVGGAMASYLTGSMNTLPGKLAELENGHMIIEPLQDLKKEYDGVAVGQKTDEAKEWMKQVRELFFTIEDWIDERPEKNTAGIPLEVEGKTKETNMAAPSEIEEKSKESNMAGPSKIEEKIKGTNLMDPLEIERKLKETNMASSSEIQEETNETKTVDPGKKIEEFKDLIDEARQRRIRYGIRDDAAACGAEIGDGLATSKITIDSRRLLEHRTCLIGLERPTETLKGLLMDGQTKLKVVSIFGTAGLGKTTLAKKIHEELRGEFKCGAFVHIVNRHTSLLKTLLNLLEQITSSKPEDHLDEQQVIAELWAFLIENRYFIIFDGIWSIRTWRVISCALPGNNLGSRILITTREKDVAKSCSPRYTDVVHQMEVLSDDDSMKLFEQEEKTQVHDVLKMCGGIPLAITVAAGLSTGEYTRLEEQKTLGQRILSSFEQYYSMSPAMVKVLHMSFADLSLPARSCFMYLSVFREYETIMKGRLIRLWDAEGFIPKIEEEILWVTGERYFNELISRRLIRPVFTCDDDQAVGCTVHTVILDFIRSISKEENFATRATELNSGPFQCDTIRRFSLDCFNEDEADTLSTSRVHLSLSSMRSLTVFGDVEGKLDPPQSPAEDERISDPQGLPSVSKHVEEMHATKAPGVRVQRRSRTRLRRVIKAVEGKLDPQGLPLVSKHGEDMHVTEAPGIPVNILSAFKLLRVLDLEDAKNLKNHHLEGIGGLVLLRYLGLAGTGITMLPEDIGGLEQLETLDLRTKYQLTTFPESRVKLKKVRHLLLQGYTKEIWEMLELEEASGICVKTGSSSTGSSSSLGTVVELLRKSEKLRMLGLIFSGEEPTKTDLVSFLKEVVKSKLQSISIGFGCSCLYRVIPLLLKSWESVTAFEPQRFELRINWITSGGLTRVPGNMGSLASLTHLHIGLGHAEAKGFLVLGGLNNLVLLSLLAEQGEKFTIKGGIFPCLKVFSFRIRNTWMGLEFEEGAMPQLQRLGRGFRVSERMNQAYPDIGIEHLTSLSRIHATINCQGVEDPEVVEKAEAAIRGEISKIATKPALELIRQGQKLTCFPLQKTSM